nr:hypothetical protein [Tanacetum cinerariifolium]
MAQLRVRAQRHPWLIYQVEGYTEEIVHDFERRLDTIFTIHVNRVHIFDLEGLTKEIREALTGRLRMVYTRAEGHVLFTSHTWRRVFEVQGLLVCEFILEFFSTCRLSDTELGLNIGDTMCFQLGRARRPERQPDSMARTLVDVKGVHAEDEGVQADPAPIQAPQPLVRKVMDAMAIDFSRFTVWAANGISLVLDLSGATYTRYSKTHVPYQRRHVKQRTDGTNTSAPQQANP